MYNDQEVFLARKYAAACLRVSLLPNDLETVTHLQMAALFFQRYGVALWHQSLDVIAGVLAQFSIKDNTLKSLLRLLEQEHRLMLFPRVFCFFVELFLKKHRIVFVRIGYSHELMPELAQQYKDSIVRLFGSSVLYLLYAKPALLAGVEIQADHWYWEHSVRRYLRACARGVIGSN
ncbi:MAG: hypothetical protein UV79_C0002G0008 [candidate division TM6 bacterium GW2011_GWF2_43_17]|nr:MAG: hypothetical protein UV79_C0002G0008 [candidate division TM6 bacterium GW2011_GWF2_43_17]HAU30175.1 hypothetical protein [Candidatus Dependentiae bacterium]